jgi:hypothetical protein
MSEDRKESQELIKNLLKRYSKSMSKLAEYDTNEKEENIKRLLMKHADLMQRLADS